MKRSTSISGLPSNQGSEVEDWLQTHVVPAVEALKADLSRGFGVDEVRSHLAAKRASTLRGVPEEQEALDFIEKAADWGE